MDNVKPKKHLGQHFLTDDNIARKIVGALEASDDQEIVEIGPGTGVLTRLLVERYNHLQLVEFDGESVAFLEKEYADKGIRIHHGDFLKWKPAAEMKAPGHFIGNLPYNVSSPIFFHLLQNREYVLSGVFMVQKEVAERIASGPGNKQYGILSVLMGYFFDLKYEFTVSEKVFHPRPKVLSGVFSMKRKEAAGDLEFSLLKKVVKTSFGQRRKTLRNSLKGLGMPLDHLDPEVLKLRPEQLSIDEFAELCRNIYDKAPE